RQAVESPDVRQVAEAQPFLIRNQKGFPSIRDPPRIKELEMDIDVARHGRRGVVVALAPDDVASEGRETARDDLRVGGEPYAVFVIDEVCAHAISFSYSAT